MRYLVSGHCLTMVWQAAKGTTLHGDEWLPPENLRVLVTQTSLCLCAFEGSDQSSIVFQPADVPMFPVVWVANDWKIQIPGG
ncbi:hypothetical protein HDK64DRAFT_279901 [Phyllosticta capitalensis]